MRNILAAAVLALTAGLAVADGDDAPKANEKAANDTLKVLTGGSVSIEQFFDGPGGLMGLVLVDNNSQRSVAWASPDGEHIILGAVFDKSGQNETAVFAKRVGTPIGITPHLRNADGSYTLSQADVALMKSLPSFEQGDGKIDLWVIGDPLCPFCKRAHTNAALPQNLHVFKIHWLLAPVVGGAQSAKIITDVLSKKITIEQAMTMERDPSFSGNVDMTPEQRKAIQSVSDLLGNSLPTPPGPGVPAVITNTNGLYSMRVGFDADALAGRPKTPPPAPGVPATTAGSP